MRGKRNHRSTIASSPHTNISTSCPSGTSGGPGIARGSASSTIQWPRSCRCSLPSRLGVAETGPPEAAAEGRRGGAGAQVARQLLGGSKRCKPRRTKHRDPRGRRQCRLKFLYFLSDTRSLTSPRGLNFPASSIRAKLSEAIWRRARFDAGAAIQSARCSGGDEKYLLRDAGSNVYSRTISGDNGGGWRSRHRFPSQVAFAV